jgi:hypothetical protein
MMMGGCDEIKSYFLGCAPCLILMSNFSKFCGGHLAHPNSMLLEVLIGELFGRRLLRRIISSIYNGFSRFLKFSKH